MFLLSTSINYRSIFRINPTTYCKTRHTPSMSGFLRL